jgi:hypothetical protein
MTDEKTVQISGTTNRYQINKLKKEPKCIKLRKATEKMGLPEEYFLLENQSAIIKDLFHETQNMIEPQYNKMIINQLESKLQNYKQQDVLKKLYDENKFIQLTEVISYLYNCQLECYYCKESLLILYDIVRATKQWTLDRIDNDLGHNSDNVIISCLDCKLKRRKRGKDAFLFTKQLNIVKN